MTSWLEICVTVENEAKAEAVADVLQLFAVGDEGVALEQLGDPEDVSPTAMLPEVLVKLYVDEARDSAEFRQTLTAALHDAHFPPPTFNLIRQQDWANAWKEHYKPLRIGKRFWIQPSWEPAANPLPDDLVITLDPGMAFGTGTHATTQLCLAALETYLQTGDDVLDLGTGSGILAIGAAQLGAGQILAVDTDELAIRASAENAAQNSVSSAIELLEGSLNVVERRGWDLVVANILAPIIVGMLQHDEMITYVKPGGVMILSGILAVQTEEVVSNLVEDATVLEVAQQGDWVAIVVQRH
ncbi:MAG: 50S ribosomal protein L11 methyltransferase [Candidatus Promineifilaceae bacterium]